MPTIPERTLFDAAFAALVAKGVDRGDAEVVARHVVDANLVGHDSHGVSMLLVYLAGMSGEPRPPTRARLVVDHGHLAVYEAPGGIGHVAATTVIDDAITRAEAHGVAIVGLRDSGHIGRCGAYGERIAERGKAGMLLVNAIGRRPTVAPFGAAESRLSSNPFCFAVPGDPPIILDAATAAIAIGKARLADERGQPLASDLLLDDQGNPTTDPAFALREPLGALLAFGGHKGSGLGLMIDLLCGAILGGGTARPGARPTGRAINNLFAFIVDPMVMAQPQPWQEEVDALARWIRSARPREPGQRIRMPGEIEEETRRIRHETGIPLDDATWDALQNLALPRAP